jgi:D-beta-D-heptose 7-phosphate kinase/D-beta-D-heptose 1-phosphate adenosyltransferase
MDDFSKANLVSIIENLKLKKILVVGDLMLDQYIWGSVERISPEGPIPVLHVKKEEFRLGGAANVAVNVKHLDCKVFPVGLVGTDYSGDRILEIFKGFDIITTGIIRDQSFQTIVKQRAITDQQQLLRIDYESKTPDTAPIQDLLLKTIGSLIPKMDGIILSDYAKGVLGKDLIRTTIDLARKKGIPVICDPGKGVDFSCYRRITSIKPNRAETEQATGILLNGQDSVLKAAKTLKETCEADFITISLDREGILYYGGMDNYRFIESKVPEVYDVTGAGDTLISTIAVLLANKISPLEATYIANIAAGLETSHLGVVPIPWSEIHRSISGDGFSRKITTLEKLLAQQKDKRDVPLIFTNGYFDNISAGHLRFLLEISKFQGNLVVAINSDASITRQKGDLPLLKEFDRARLLASLENVHHIIVFDDDDASELIRSLAPNIVVKGEQFRGQQMPELEAISEVGATIEYVQHFSWNQPSYS